MPKKEEFETFAGVRVFDVDEDTYHRCLKGCKGKHERYSKYIDETTEAGKAIKKYAYRNKDVMLRDSSSPTNPMLYLKWGTKK